MFFSKISGSLLTQPVLATSARSLLINLLRHEVSIDPDVLFNHYISFKPWYSFSLMSSHLFLNPCTGPLYLATILFCLCFKFLFTPVIQLSTSLLKNPSAHWY